MSRLQTNPLVMAVSRSRLHPLIEASCLEIQIKSSMSFADKSTIDSSVSFQAKSIDSSVSVGHKLMDSSVSFADKSTIDSIARGAKE